jgi:hypothetical protein
MENCIERRIYRREFADLLGYGPTWFRKLEKSGVIPSGRSDPGGRRKFWLESEAREIAARLNAAAVRGGTKP